MRIMLPALTLLALLAGCTTEPVELFSDSETLTLQAGEFYSSRFETEAAGTLHFRVTSSTTLVDVGLIDAAQLPNVEAGESYTVLCGDDSIRLWEDFCDVEAHKNYAFIVMNPGDEATAMEYEVEEVVEA